MTASSTRLALSVAACVLSSILQTPPAAAGTIDAALQGALEGAGPEDRIPVIVDLVDPDPRLTADAVGSRREQRSARLRDLRARSDAAQRSLREHLRVRGVAEHRVLWAINSLAVEAPPRIVVELAARDDVAAVRLDATVTFAPPEVRTAAEPEWNIAMIGAPDLWARGHTGEGVVIAILDSGVDRLHQELIGRYRGGGNSWFDPYAQHPEPYDADGHGTHVAGLIVAGDAGGTAIGTAPGATWIAARVFDDSGDGRLSEIHAAMQWLLDPDDDPDTDDAPHVVNGSWGFQERPDECYLEFAEDIDLLRAAGIAVVFSAGNGGPTPASSVSPANNPGAFAVGAVDGSGQVYLSSARGPSACGGGTFPNLVAPGVDVRTTDRTFGGAIPDASTGVSGTSFAAPHVAGAMALLLSAHPGATVSQLEQSLVEGAEDLGPDGPDDDSGHGLLDVVKAETVLASLVGGGAGVTVFSDENGFLAAVAEADVVLEGFEAEPPWDAVRTTAVAGTHAADSVTHLGITWTSNHAHNRITTSSGAARTGDWGLYSAPHGDQTVPQPTDFITDGVAGASDRRLTGVGGWFTGTAGGKLSVVLDGNEGRAVELGPIDPTHRFYGVVDPSGFTSFEFRELEGTLEDQRFVFVDDVTVAAAAAAVPPTDGVVAGVADIRGAAGSDWHTDLYLHNASASPVDVRLFFSPSGGGVGTPVDVTVDANATDTLADVVSGTFGATGSGAVLWRVTSGDPHALLVSANTYNRLDEVGIYGQQVPGVRWSTAAPAGTPVVVPAVAGAFRTNLGFAVDGDCTEVVVRGFDRSGALQAERTIAVDPLSWTQLNRVFRREFPGLVANPDAVATADSLHRFEVVGVDGRVVAYTSVIDNATNDGAYMLGRWTGDTDGRLWLPGAAFLRGANSSQWRSDVMVMNLSGAADTATLAYLPSAADNGGALATRTVPLTDGQAVFEGNVLRELFGMFPPAVGTLALDAARSVAWMRTYTEEVADLELWTYGQAIPALAAAEMIAPGGEGRVFGFSSDDRTRSNLILQNTLADGSGALLPATVHVEVIDRRGLAVHQHSYDLRSGEYLQHNGFLSDYGLGWMTGAALRFVITDAPPEATAGGVAAMVSEVNGAALSGTNDGRLLTATPLPGATAP